METLAGLLELAFLVSFIVAIVYGVKWFKQRKDKESDQFKKSKKKFRQAVFALYLIYKNLPVFWQEI